MKIKVQEFVMKKLEEMKQALAVTVPEMQTVENSSYMKYNHKCKTCKGSCNGVCLIQ